MTLRIILADDQPKVRFALRVLLESLPDVDIVGEVEDARELMEQLSILSPTSIILDWLLPGLSEIGSIESLRDRTPDVAIIALSGRPELGHEAIAHGADSFVSKIDPPDRLLEILGQLAAEKFP